MNQIALLMPTRGLIFPEVLESLESASKGIPRFYSHSQPIPDSFNNLATEALRSDWKITHIWFVEEDVVVPPNALELMLDLDTDIAAITYPLKQAPDRLCFGEVQGQLVWVGMGCTLIRREVFDAIEYPWFQTDCFLVTRHSGSASDWILDLDRRERPYGGQDLYFCFQAIKKGFQIKLVEEVQCDHLSV